MDSNTEWACVYIQHCLVSIRALTWSWSVSVEMQCWAAWPLSELPSSRMTRPLAYSELPPERWALLMPSCVDLCSSSHPLKHAVLCGIQWNLSLKENWLLQNCLEWNEFLWHHSVFISIVHLIHWSLQSCVTYSGTPRYNHPKSSQGGYKERVVLVRVDLQGT